jgi:di/tricarboxylate transporter
LKRRTHVDAYYNSPSLNPAVLSLLALVVAIALSMTSQINVGWVAIAFAWIIGVYVAGLRPEAVMAGFPVTLFLTLTGVSLLFAIAESNGTLGVLTQRGGRQVRGDARLAPLFLFTLACALSSIGPGAVATVALLAPVGMSLGHRLRVPALLTALMIANGANAGNLSPFSSVGIIANSAMAKTGLAGHEGRVWFANFAAHVAVSAVVYIWMARRLAPRSTAAADEGEAESPRFSRTQLATLIAIAFWILGVVAFNVSLGLSAFAIAALLLVARAADERVAVQAVPWGIIMMVCGVSVLIALLEKTGGMDLFTSVLARAASPSTINGTIAFVTGAISTYSSTSGVVLPAFLPTVSTLVTRLGGGDPLAIALSINVGASLVDVSPLSTIGALCVAAASDESESRPLFRQLMIWGLSMTIVGAALCQAFAGLLARA